MVKSLPFVLLAFILVATQAQITTATVSVQPRASASILEPTDSLVERRDIPLIRQPQSEILSATRSVDEEEDGAQYPDPSHIPTPPHGKKKNGHHCTHSTLCRSGNCHRSRCHPRLHVGHRCTKDANCITQYCVKDRCVHTPQHGLLGKYCNQSSQCKSGYCHHHRCDYKKGGGHRCYKDQGCISGKCHNGRCA